MYGLEGFPSSLGSLTWNRKTWGLGFRVKGSFQDSFQASFCGSSKGSAKGSLSEGCGNNASKRVAY